MSERTGARLDQDFGGECVLQGKTVPLDVVKVILERGDRLAPGEGQRGQAHIVRYRDRGRKREEKEGRKRCQERMALELL
jgi:hypothetical protein